jgi:release factor glutamine methyltransferase
VSEAALVARLRAVGCVFAEDEARLLLGAAGSPAELEAMVARRVAGEPLEHVLGFVDFHGLRLEVAPGVFVPRTRTGFLVDTAVAPVLADRPGRGPAVVLDLCCGCGAVGAAVAASLAGRSVGCELHAADLDPVAVEVARRNLAPYGGRVGVGDLFDPVPADLRGRVDLLVANTPYVPSDAVALMPPEARDHEERLALDGGPDGLALLRRIASAAPVWLAPGGHLLIEIARAQAEAALAAYRDAGLAAWTEHDDDRDATLAVAHLR